MPDIKLMVMPDSWDTIERIEGHCLGFNYQVVRLGNGAWRGTVNVRGREIKFPHIVKDSPGETLCALIETIREKKESR